MQKWNGIQRRATCPFVCMYAFLYDMSQCLLYGAPKGGISMVENETN